VLEAPVVCPLGGVPAVVVLDAPGRIGDFHPAVAAELERELATARTKINK